MEGHRRLGDSEGESFDDGRLSHARFAGQDGIVLPAPRENIDDLPNLTIATQDRIDLATLGTFRKIDRELIQRRSLGRALGLPGWLSVVEVLGCPASTVRRPAKGELAAKRPGQSCEALRRSPRPDARVPRH
jgi:hypothetical protein